MIRLSKNYLEIFNDIIGDMQRVINLWEQEPMQIGSTERRRAHIRQVRDMKSLG